MTVDPTDLGGVGGVTGSECLLEARVRLVLFGCGCFARRQQLQKRSF